MGHLRFREAAEREREGVRALLHGAFGIGLMKYCQERKRSHPGFLILDTLFMTYRDPDGPDDDAIKATPLKDKAFASFAELSKQHQLIILDNVDVPDWLPDRSNYIDFTAQVTQGRAGFFPPPRIRSPH